MKFSYLQTITTSNALWIQKTRALDMSNGLKSCQGTTSGLIIDKAKLMELIMPCVDTPSGVLRKKSTSQEHQDPKPTAIFVGTSLGVKRLGFKCPLPPLPSPHL